MTRFLALLFTLSMTVPRVYSQYSVRVSPKLTVSTNSNIDTYYIVEKLAVDHIGFMIFTRKDSVYAHQPLLNLAYQTFKKYVNTPNIKRSSEIIQYLRDTLHDNAPFIQYLLYQQEFPKRGVKYPFVDSLIFQPATNPAIMGLVRELDDSLYSFYRMARVGEFIRKNKKFYQGAIHEVVRDINPLTIPAMEKYYGQQFNQYVIVLMPLMPIPAGEDNYRAFGPTMHWPQGQVSGMLFSTTAMLPVQKSITLYNRYGYANKKVTQFLTVHEFGHSFINPHIAPFFPEIERDTALFTPALHRLEAPFYIDDWRNCVIEHIVRLGEIRVAASLNDTAEVNRLRKMHIQEFHFIFLPLLEDRIKLYETNREKYPTISSFLPELLDVFHKLTPERVDELVTENQQ